MKHKNGFLTFICACVPGSGQMYLGYMKRGLSLAAFFWLAIASAYFLRLDGMIFLMPVIWLYAFFDTYNIRSQTVEEHNAMPDEYILGNGFYKTAAEDKNRTLVGWVCIVLGCVLLYNVVVLDLIADRLWNVLPFLASLLNRIPSLLVGIAVIWLGARFAFGARQKKESAAEEDYHGYAGVQAAATPAKTDFPPAQQPTVEETMGNPGETATPVFEETAVATTLPGKAAHKRAKKESAAVQVPVTEATKNDKSEEEKNAE